ncbi:hypothetical protein KGQ20_44955 [Catenulispora sp. NF23]|uniref:Uncharacterized protein n=1 Tax=Catenulispora pinistramenti TaxID=2705254 RepID=A0ABS5KN71_9ACTN|nr:hypothetical protein [Catenulispora pinistramenti]MBS2539915.1 hypothetical protein [Catenulispora pinistramenti]MBS2547466.1 hypothetical protein [Catenulispora pinistramenti]
MSEPSFAEGPDARFYPDLVESGSLSQALRVVADAEDLDVGNLRPGSSPELSVYRTAETDSDHGLIRVSTVLNRRAFSISIDSAKGNFVWADGSTTDLADVTRVIHAWCSGVVLAVLNARFPFMEFSRQAEGFERGNPSETAWDILLEDTYYAPQRGVLSLLCANPALSKLFPFYSHDVLRLAMDPFDRGAGEIKIERRNDGRFDVTRSPGGNHLMNIEIADLAAAGASLL